MFSIHLSIYSKGPDGFVHRSGGGTFRRLLLFIFFPLSPKTVGNHRSFSFLRVDSRRIPRPREVFIRWRSSVFCLQIRTWEKRPQSSEGEEPVQKKSGAPTI